MEKAIKRIKIPFEELIIKLKIWFRGQNSDHKSLKFLYISKTTFAARMTYFPYNRQRLMNRQELFHGELHLTSRKPRGLGISRRKYFLFSQFSCHSKAE